MIDIAKYKVILEQGLILDHYFLLCNIRDGKELSGSKRIQGFINLMCKKGYIEDGALTKKAFDLLNEKVEESVFKPIKLLQAPVVEEVKKDKMDYADWVISLHRKCQDKLEKLTGKKQVRPMIEGKPYSFLPNSTDLGRVILRAIQIYKLKDYDRIEKTIMKYIERCSSCGKWYPLLNYYIMKDSMSKMVTDMESPDEETSTDNPTIHIV